MSILDLTGENLDDFVEPTTVPAGEEYKLKIVSFIIDTDKNGVDFIMPFFEVPGEPYCKEFGDYLPMPSQVANEKDANRARGRLSAFGAAFDIPISGGNIDTDDYVGNEGWAILGMGKDRDGEPCNKINKYVAGH